MIDRDRFEAGAGADELAEAAHTGPVAYLGIFKTEWHAGKPSRGDAVCELFFPDGDGEGEALRSEAIGRLRAGGAFAGCECVTGLYECEDGRINWDGGYRRASITL